MPGHVLIGAVKYKFVTVFLITPVLRLSVSAVFRYLTSEKSGVIKLAIAANVDVNISW